jgi:hypothetical protein
MSLTDGESNESGGENEKEEHHRHHHHGRGEAAKPPTLGSPGTDQPVTPSGTDQTPVTTPAGTDQPVTNPAGTDQTPVTTPAGTDQMPPIATPGSLPANTASLNQALSQVTFDSGVSQATQQQVLNTFQNSPQSMIDAFNAMGTKMVISSQGIGSGIGGYFDPGSNQVVIDGSSPNDIRETVDHELFHVADQQLGITGSAQWQQMSAADFARVDPNSLGLPVQFVDAPVIAGVGSSDVAAELTAFAAGNDQTGTGSALAQTYPDLYQYIKQSLGA